MTTKKPPKTHTVAEVDASNAASYVEGMAMCYTLLIEEVEKVEKSIGDVWAMYSLGELDDHKLAVTADMKAVSNAIKHIKDVLEGAYYDALDGEKLLSEEEQSRLWRNSIASLKEEWPL